MLTEDRVHEIATQLSEAGHPVTLVRVREANGHSGSLSTISRYLTTWRQGRSARADAEARRDPAIDALERLAPGTYARVVGRVEDHHRNKITSLQADLDAMHLDRGALVAALATSEARADELVQLVSNAQGERATAIEALATVRTLSADVQALTTRLAALTESSLATRAAVIEAIVTSHERTAEAYQATEQDLAGLGEHLSAGFARVLEQLVVEQRAATTRSQHDRDAVNASVADQLARLATSLSNQMQSLAASNRTAFMATQKALAGLGAATRMAAQFPNPPVREIRRESPPRSDRKRRQLPQ